MLYATRQDIEQLYGVDYLAMLLPRDADPDISTATAIASESATVDAYLSVRYQLPLAEVPANLEVAAVDLICYRLAATNDRLTDEIANRAKMALAFLRDLSSGKARLGLAEPVVDAGAPRGAYTTPEGAEFSSRPRMFNRRGSLE